MIQRKGVFILSKILKSVEKKHKNIHFLLFVGSDSRQNFKSAKKKILNENYEIKTKTSFFTFFKA